MPRRWPILQVKGIWATYTPIERTNIFLYILGLMLYKVGYEIYNGSLITMAMQRFGDKNVSVSSDDGNDAAAEGIAGKLGLLQSLNLGCQCLGGLAAVGLVGRLGGRRVLGSVVGLWAVVVGIFFGIDFRIGGKESGVFGVFGATGTLLGLVEVGRKVLVREIIALLEEQQEEDNGWELQCRGSVGEKEEKTREELAELDGTRLRRVDALIHILYELAGTAGALLSAELMVRLGSNISLVFSCGMFFGAGLVWFYGLRGVERKRKETEQGKREDGSDTSSGTTYTRNESCKHLSRTLASYFSDSFHFLRTSFRTLVTSPSFSFLPLSYSLSLYSHRYLENALAPLIAKYILKEPAYHQIIVGGSNLGELLGALMVFSLSEKVRSPLWWVRLDALCLSAVWAVVGVCRALSLRNRSAGKMEVKYAYLIGAIFVPISFGWAAGDVSLNAYLQGKLGGEGSSEGRDKVKYESGKTDRDGKKVGNSDLESSAAPRHYPSPPAIRSKQKNSRKNRISWKGLTSLTSIISILYIFYIVLYSVLNPVLGKYVDGVLHTPSSSTVARAIVLPSPSKKRNLPDLGTDVERTEHQNSPVGSGLSILPNPARGYNGGYLRDRNVGRADFNNATTITTTATSIAAGKRGESAGEIKTVNKEYRSEHENKDEIQDQINNALLYIGGVQYTVISILVGISSFFPGIFTWVVERRRRERARKKGKGRAE